MEVWEKTFAIISLRPERYFSALTILSGKRFRVFALPEKSAMIFITSNWLSWPPLWPLTKYLKNGYQNRFLFRSQPWRIHLSVFQRSFDFRRPCELGEEAGRGDPEGGPETSFRHVGRYRLEKNYLEGLGAKEGFYIANINSSRQTVISVSGKEKRRIKSLWNTKPRK